MPHDEELPPNASKKLYALLHEFSDVISAGDTNLGHTTLTQYQINTGDTTPVHQPPRRLPPCQTEVWKLIDDVDEGSRGAST